MASDDQAYQKPTLVKVKIFDHVAEGNAPIVESPKKAEVEFQTSKSPDCSTMEEEDVCPTCFEEYDTENPRIVTKCNHQFHLSCILEWMERSNTCPICSQVFLCTFVCVSHPGSPVGPVANMTKYKLRKPHAKLMGPEFDTLASTLCCFLASCHR
ncbi:putative transcription factor C2H2 family [Helianthus annuus]|nr:putative transcription factor C2H2 family [Helianthus annuus]